MLKVLRNKKAEGYIDVAVAVLVIVFALIFSVSIFSKVAISQDLKHMCKELVDVATQTGRIGPEVNARYEELCKEAGIRPDMEFKTTYFNASDKTVQLGDIITCKLTYKMTLQGLGDFELPIDVDAEYSGLSEVYWK